MEQSKLRVNLTKLNDESLINASDFLYECLDYFDNMEDKEESTLAIPSMLTSLAILGESVEHELDKRIKRGL